MTSALQLASSRLLLRAWQDRDRAPFSAMNADPTVMRFFAAPMTEQESNEAIDRYNEQLARDGFTMYAAEDPATGTFLGAIGAQTMRFAVPGLAQPAIEIGWRLASSAQGRGLATEGAQLVLRHVLQHKAATQIVAITVPDNLPSRRVMEKLGMTHRPELTFEHPLVPIGEPRRQHILYSFESIYAPTLVPGEVSRLTP